MQAPSSNDILYNYFAGNDLLRVAALKNGLATRSLHDLASLIADKSKTLQRRDMLTVMHDFDISNTLPNSYLAAMDRGSMRAGLEVRAPLLNTELFKFMRTFNKKRLLFKVPVKP